VCDVTDEGDSKAWIGDGLQDVQANFAALFCYRLYFKHGRITIGKRYMKGSFLSAGRDTSEALALNATNGAIHCAVCSMI